MAAKSCLAAKQDNAAARGSVLPPAGTAQRCRTCTASTASIRRR